jgi:diacylglycerol kinase (ATP)
MTSQPGPQWTRVVLIANPKAGAASARLLDEVAACCAPAAEIQVLTTAGPADATDLARAAAKRAAADSRRTLVVSVGGDGTACAVAAGLTGQDAPPGAGPPAALMVIPAGTANSSYRSWWGEVPWRQALARALAGRAPRLLDLARLELDGAAVLAGACAGFPPQGIHEASFITDLSGPDRYEAAMARLIPRFEPYPGRVVVDGTEVHRGPTVFANVGGSRYRGGNFSVLPRTVLDDGMLDVCVVGAGPSLPGLLRLARTGAHADLPGAVYARGRRITLERTDGEPVWFERDGEVAPPDGAAYTLEVLPAAVPVVVGEAAPLRPAGGPR